MPPNYAAARKYPDAQQWTAAHHSKLDALDTLGAIKWTPPSSILKNVKPLPLTMSYIYKRDNNNSIIRRKSRESVRGDLMKPQVHYDPEKTATHMADKASLRILFAITAQRQLLLDHFYFDTAFLDEKFQHPNPVYIKQHPRFNSTYEHPEKIGKLIGNLYGTRQGGHIYLEAMKAHLQKKGYRQLKSDPCLFTAHGPEKKEIFIAVCIYDILAAATHQSMLDQLHRDLKSKYEVKRIQNPTQYINWKITRNTHGIHISRPHIITAISAKIN